MTYREDLERVLAVTGRAAKQRRVNWSCNKCDSKQALDYETIFSNGKMHIKRICLKCKSYLKFSNKDEFYGKISNDSVKRKKHIKPLGRRNNFLKRAEYHKHF